MLLWKSYDLRLISAQKSTRIVSFFTNPSHIWPISLLTLCAGVFLFCWVPFFTCNVMDAICTKLGATCQPSLAAFIITTWLGYMNSFVNPVIYTIFNPEFRKAFKKLMNIGTWSSVHHFKSVSATWLTFSTTTCVNPVIYNIFNPESRKKLRFIWR